LLYSRAPCRKSVRKMKALGVIYAEDMLPEVAYVKLGWVLGHGLEPGGEMPKDYVGEISERAEEGFGWVRRLFDKFHEPLPAHLALPYYLDECSPIHLLVIGDYGGDFLIG